MKIELLNKYKFNKKTGSWKKNNVNFDCKYKFIN